LKTELKKVNHDAVETLSNNLKVSLKQKKHQLVVEVESLALSGKNYDASMRMGRRRCRKNKKSRRTFNKNSCDLLTEI